MSAIVDVHEAKTHLSRLLERVRRGEEVVIGKGGRPIARLGPEGRVEAAFAASELIREAALAGLRMRHRGHGHAHRET